MKTPPIRRMPSGSDAPRNPFTGPPIAQPNIAREQMARRRIPSDEREARDGPDLAGAGSGVAESQIRSEEIFRMAAFRIRETANRIATLSHSARDPALQRELQIVCERLLEEERRLLELTSR